MLKKIKNKKPKKRCNKEGLNRLSCLQLETYTFTKKQMVKFIKKLSQ